MLVSHPFSNKALSTVSGRSQTLRNLGEWIVGFRDGSIARMRKELRALKKFAASPKVASFQPTKPLETWWEKQKSILEVLRRNAASCTGLPDDQLDGIIEEWRKAEEDLTSYVVVLREVSVCR